MTNIKRLDRLIVRLVFIRNLLTRNDGMDIDLDLHPTEAEITTIFDQAVTISEELSNDNARN